jgi:hypothetical protein
MVGSLDSRALDYQPRRLTIQEKFRLRANEVIPATDRFLERPPLSGQKRTFRPHREHVDLALMTHFYRLTINFAVMHNTAFPTTMW